MVWWRCARHPQAGTPVLLFSGRFRHRDRNPVSPPIGTLSTMTGWKACRAARVALQLALPRGGKGCLISLSHILLWRGSGEGSDTLSSTIFRLPTSPRKNFLQARASTSFKASKAEGLTKYEHHRSNQSHCSAFPDACRDRSAPRANPVPGTAARSGRLAARLQYPSGPSRAHLPCGLACQNLCERADAPADPLAAQRDHHFVQCHAAAARRRLVDSSHRGNARLSPRSSSCGCAASICSTPPISACSSRWRSCPAPGYRPANGARTWPWPDGWSGWAGS